MNDPASGDTKELVERLRSYVADGDTHGSLAEHPTTIAVRIDIEKAADALLTNAAEIAGLRDALRPFADCVEQISDDEDDEEWAKFRLLIKDYRRARAALEGRS